MTDQVVELTSRQVVDRFDGKIGLTHVMRHLLRLAQGNRPLEDIVLVVPRPLLEPGEHIAMYGMPIIPADVDFAFLGWKIDYNPDYQPPTRP